MLGDDYYEILGITRDATDKEVRQAYRRMVKRYHPDLNPDMPDAERYLRAVVIAYQTLGNKRRRADYDHITSLFGPKRKPLISTDQKATSRRQTTMSELERRKREASRPLLAWFIFVNLLLSSYLVWTLYTSGSLFGRMQISPVIYAETFTAPSSAYKAFRKEPVEDEWYLWYRNINYRLLMGEWGSARELAAAYTKVSRHAMLKGDLVLAHNYATAAAEIDPGYNKAVHLEKSLRLRLKSLPRH